MTADAVRVFISYSHKDEALRDRLATHLSNLQWQGIIDSWYDRQLTAGTEWDNKIKTELEAADIILLLISPDFIASKYCRDVEIPIALQRHEAKLAYVVPVILRPFDWFDAPFAKLQAFPKDAKPITTWPNQDEAFVSVAQGIRTAAKLMQGYRQQQTEQSQLIRSQYLQKVEEVLSDGVISIVERDTLDELREALGLTLEAAQEIETHAYEPYSRYQENLNKYQQTLKRLIEKGYYPFNEDIERDLINRQRDLGLKPEDAARIAQPILDQAELDDQSKRTQLAEAERLQALEQQQQAEHAPKAVADRQLREPHVTTHHQTLAGTNPAANPLTNANNKLQRFEFDVITVNKNGIENSRTPYSAEFFAEDLGNGVWLEMVKLPSGKFQMGSPSSQGDGDERPQHAVTVPAYLIGKYPVTQAQWQVVATLPQVEIALDTDPARFKGSNYPVEQVSWHEAVEFCQRLSRATGQFYRLPSEAEWEYACRARTIMPFHFGATITTKLANYNGNYTYGITSKGDYREQTTMVGTFTANAFGLYDMHGNVREWCADHWHCSYVNAPTDGTAWITNGDSAKQICRGGSWYNYPAFCRAACRLYYNPANRSSDLGFRVVCAIFPGLF